MPIYEYVCASCGAGFERRLKVEERLRPQPCPGCGEEHGAFRFSTPAILGKAADAQASGFCPSTGRACGCAHAHKH